MAVLRVVPNLFAADPAGLADWYRRVLGLDVVMDLPGDAVVYGPVDEPWGLRRVYLRDPEGNLVNVLRHAGTEE